MTQIAVIHLPLKDNEGNDLQSAIDDTLRKIAEKWGGYTALPGFGGWSDNGVMYRDDILHVFVAGVENKDEWRKLAEEVKFNFRQLSVYIAFFSGEVEFI